VPRLVEGLCGVALLSQREALGDDFDGLTLASACSASRLRRIKESADAKPGFLIAS
jgi:hypothetical protein